MFLRNSALLACVALALAAQPDPRGSFKVNLPPDAPVSLQPPNWDQSSVTMRGGAMQVDLHSTLYLRNTGGRRIRGISFLVLAQEVTPGGKASVTVPSLDVDPGESFPVKIDLRLMRPPAAASGALVEVLLDGVLFEDLTFFGPNRINSRRAMTAYELEARRDRRFFLARLDAGGPTALQGEMIATLNRIASQPRLEIQSARAGRSSNSVGSEQQIEFSMLELPEAPVELLGGLGRVSGNEARLPKLDLRNRSRRPVRSLEIGWLMKDTAGREYYAGDVPADLALKPGERSEFVKDSTLRFARPGGQPVPIATMTAYVAGVEFADGDQWIPSHSALSTPRLSSVLPVSPEAQRLAELYSRKGLDAVTRQLQRLR